MIESNDIVVSIGMIAYNHEQFIEQALDSILSQSVDFKFEIVIGEDCSTDNTRKICLTYQEKYPEKIKLLLPDVNVGMTTNFVNTLLACEGKYTAFCEGDDYWTDPYKLQKQVDFLENNPTYNLCSHRFRIYDEESKKWFDDRLYPQMDESREGVSFDFEVMLKDWHAQTMTVLFRTDKLKFYHIQQYEKFCDHHLVYLLLKEHNGYCMNWYGAVYRLHQGGVFSKQTLEMRTYMGYNTTRDLYIHNQDDPMLEKDFLENKYAYFENYLRLSVLKRNFSKKLLSDCLDYLKSEFKYSGMKGVLHSIKKIILSYHKSFYYNNSDELLKSQTD